MAFSPLHSPIRKQYIFRHSPTVAAQVAEQLEAKMTARILRRPKVEELTGLGRSAIYEYMARGQFPRPVRLSDTGKAVGWVEAEVSEWINARVAERDMEAI